MQNNMVESSRLHGRSSSLSRAAKAAGNANNAPLYSPPIKASEIDLEDGIVVSQFLYILSPLLFTHSRAVPFSILRFFGFVWAGAWHCLVASSLFLSLCFYFIFFSECM